MTTEMAQSNSKHPDGPRTGRTAILAAARRVLSRDGAAAVSFKGVAKEAGVTPEVVSGHFQNPQEMVVAVADDLASFVRSMHAEDGKEKSAQDEPQPQPRDVFRKKVVLPAPLEQVMREVAPEPEKDPVLTGAMQRLERRLQVMEKAFADIVERHEKSIRERTSSLSSIEENIGAVLSRMDTTDKHHTAMFEELRLALTNASDRVNVLEGEKRALLPASAMSVESAPVPEFAPVAESHKVLDLVDMLPASAAKPSDEPARTDANAGDASRAAVSETYLSAARRAANAAAAVAVQEGMLQKLDGNRARKGNRAKFLLFACLAPVAILGAAFIVLNQNAVTAEPVESGETIALSSPPASPASPDQPAAAEQTAAPGQPQPAPQVAVAEPADPTRAELATAAPVKSLTQLAQAGDVKAARDVGLKYLAGDGVGADESEAARWLMRAAYKGEPTAEYWLATLYARGHGVPADAFQANHWYEAAAKQGNRRAMHSVAVAHFQGSGMEKNFVEAARWFEKAAELGLVDSQFNLGVLYERGAGVPQSLTDAYKWYAIAAAQGDKEADARVAFLATQLRPADLALAQSAAASFKPAAMDETANLGTGPAPLPGG